MEASRIRQLLNTAVEGRWLLRHPFYQRWEAGELTPDELGRYAEQYRTIEGALPSILSSIVDALPEGPARHLVEENLNDEMGRPAPHIALFEDFAESVGARRDVAPTDATSAVVSCQLGAVRQSPAAGLAALAAYEVQAADIAASKAEGLRRHYGMPLPAVHFWDVHAETEAVHAGWTTIALGDLVTEETEVLAAASSAASAWWEFLTDREAEGGRLAIAI
jgi:pyrroloquinoline-quinone synthase